MEEIINRLKNIENRISLLEEKMGVNTVGIQKSSLAEEQQIQVDNLANKSTLPPVKKKSLESRIGQWWLGFVGIIAVIFGVSFFIKYAFENDLIGETGRVMLGVFAGLIFIILGEFLRRQYPKYSYILSGGGLSMFYLSAYSAVWFYDLISLPVAFAFMIFVSLFGVALSLWANAVELASIALVGGFLTPFLVATKIGNDFGFLFYTVILNLIILLVAFFKKWHVLTLLGFAGTAIHFSSWHAMYYDPDKLSVALYSLSIFYSIYLMGGIIPSVVEKKESDNIDFFVLTLVPVWYVGWLLYFLRPEYDIPLGFGSALLSFVYILFAYMFGKLPNTKNLKLYLGGISSILLTMAIPLALEASAVTIAWFAEAFVLLCIGLYLKNRTVFLSSVVVYAIALFRIFVFSDTFVYLNDKNFTPIFNEKFLVYIFSAILTAGMIYVFYAMIDRDNINDLQEQKNNNRFKAVLVLGFNLLLLISVTQEIQSIFNKKALPVYDAINIEYEKIYRLPESSDPSVGLIEPDYSQLNVLNEIERSIRNQKNASISVFWTLYAVFLIVVGIVAKSAFLRWNALILFGITILKVFIIDLGGLSTPYRIISFTILGLILLLASYLYFKYQDKE